MKECPRCKLIKLHDDDVFNSLSRRDSKTYICNNCGSEEGMIDAGFMEPDDLEREFVKTHKRS